MNIIIGCTMFLLFLFGFALGKMKGMEEAFEEATKMIQEAGAKMGFKVKVTDKDEDGDER